MYIFETGYEYNSSWIQTKSDTVKKIMSMIHRNFFVKMYMMYFCRSDMKLINYTQIV